MNDFFLIINNDNTFSKNQISNYSKVSKLEQVGINLLSSSNSSYTQSFNHSVNGNDIFLICTGEIYNYKELYNLINVTPKTNFSCEVIIYLYINYGIENTLQILDGIFSFVLYDNNLHNNDSSFSEKIYVARDPLGAIPFYNLKVNLPNNNKVFCFSTELKSLNKFYNKDSKIKQITPGTYSLYELSFKIFSNWKLTEKKNYYQAYNTLISNNSFETEKLFATNGIQYNLLNVIKNICAIDKPFACLLSADLGSIIITYFVNEEHKKKFNKPVETYSIGFKNSKNLYYAKEFSNFFKTNHTEIFITKEDMFENIYNVINIIENYDIYNVRKSIYHYLLGNYISKNSNAKVIFNGDGLNELCGNYTYMKNNSNDIEFDIQIRNFLKEVHLFNLLRNNKCMSYFGLESKTPFLDKSFVQFYLSIPLNIRIHNKPNFKLDINLNKCKSLIIDSFQKEIESMNFLFSKPNFLIDKEIELYTSHIYNNMYDNIHNENENKNTEFELSYYRSIFNYYYPELTNIKCPKV